MTRGAVRAGAQGDARLAAAGDVCRRCSFKRIGALLALSVLLARPDSLRAQTSEPLHGVRVIHRVITNSSIVSQRVIVTTPEGPVQKRPTVLVASWLSCDAVQVPASGPGNDAALALLQQVIETSGMTVVRVEKPGLPGSLGRCEDTDVDTELAGYRAAFDALGSYAEVDTARVTMLGLSNGGGWFSTAPTWPPFWSRCAGGRAFTRGTSRSG